MKRELIKRAYDTMTPDEAARQRMLKRIMEQGGQNVKKEYSAQPQRGKGWIGQLAAVLVLLCLLACTVAVLNRNDGSDQLGTVNTENTIDTTEPVPPESAERIDTYEELLVFYCHAIAENWGTETCQEVQISTLVVQHDSPAELGYQLIDLDGDGAEELLISDGEIIYDLYTLVDGRILRLFTSSRESFYQLCEGNILYYQGARSVTGTVYEFIRWESGKLSKVAALLYDHSQETNTPWQRQNLGNTIEGEEYSPITEEEFTKILDSHPRITIEITVFPAENQQAVEDFKISLFYWTAMEYSAWINSDAVPNQWQKQAEIAEHFDMKAYTGDDRGTDSYDYFLEEMGLESFLRGDVEGTEWDIESCWYYNQERFNVAGSVTMAWEGSPRTVPVDFNFYRTAPDYLFPVLSEMGSLENYEYWEYTLTSGETVILARNEEAAYVIVYRTEEVYFVVVDNWKQSESDRIMTREALEALAELFRYEMMESK